MSREKVDAYRCLMCGRVYSSEDSICEHLEEFHEETIAENDDVDLSEYYAVMQVEDEYCG